MIGLFMESKEILVAVKKIVKYISVTLLAQS